MKEGKRTQTIVDRPQSLDFLEDTIHQLQTIERCLSPSMLAKYTNGLLPQRVDILGMLSEVKHDLRKHVGGGVNGDKRQGQLHMNRVVPAILGNLSKPFNGIQVFRRLPCRFQRLPTFEHTSHHSLGFADQTNQRAAVREEPINKGAHECGPGFELKSRLRDMVCIRGGDTKPICVATKLVTEEQARRYPRYSLKENRM